MSLIKIILTVVTFVLALQVVTLAALDGASSASNFSHPAERQLPLDPPTSRAPNIVQAPDEDVDDTFSGRNFDSFPIFPISKLHGKQYVDPTTGKKYRIKPKTEDTEEKVKVPEDLRTSISHLMSTAAPVPFQSTESSFNETDGEQSSEVIDGIEGNSTTDFEVDGSIVSTAASIESESRLAIAAATVVNHQSSSLDAGAITGITLGIVVIFGLIGAISFVVYRRKFSNKPQVLNDKSSTLDSSGYIDDASLRENSEEMYSLDNDSFLNSLEAMTIQNYWTENVKHTKL